MPAIMDSGNSGSMQSSSGVGDDDHDSRSESMISAFVNSSTASSAAAAAASEHLHPSYDLSYDPLLLSNFLESVPRSPAPPLNLNSLLSLDDVWAGGQQQQNFPVCTDSRQDLLMGCSSSLTSAPISVSSDQVPFPIAANSSSSPSKQLPVGSENGGHTPGSRNPKKRSRASRRAPTTVLTTDTSNFRAMVQEFTGIPAPPFSTAAAAAAAFPRPRLDLFNTAASLRSALLNSPLPPYLLQPLVQKQLPHLPFPLFASLPFGNSSSAASSIIVDPTTSPASNSVKNACSTAPTETTNAKSFQLPCDLGVFKQNPNLLNPGFTFQSQAANSTPPGAQPAGADIELQQFAARQQQLGERQHGSVDGFTWRE